MKEKKISEGQKDPEIVDAESKGTGAPKKKEKVNKLKAGSLLLLGFMVVYIPSVFHWIYGNNITTDIIRMGVIEESYNVQGLVIRDEVMLDASPFNGRYIQEAAEGDRVPVSGRVATVLEKSSLGLLDELDKKNVEIVEAQNERAKNTEIYSEDISKIQASIDESVQVLIYKCSNNSLADIKPLREDINKLIEKRAEIVGTGSNDSYINTLKKERNVIQKRIDSNTKHIISKCAGTISYVIDGCEQKLTPLTMGNLLPKELEAIKTEISGSRGDAANAGKPFVKIIKGNSIYMAAALDIQKANMLKESGNIKIRINDIDKVFAATVVSVSKEVNGKSVITVKVDRGIDELSGVRRVNIDLIKDMYEGLKIPLRSFKSLEPDGKSGTIVIVKANVTSLRTVEILGKNNEFAIIKSPEEVLKKVVGLYDSYILDSKNVEEGQIINQ